MQKLVVQIFLFYSTFLGVQISAQDSISVKFNFTGENFVPESNTMLTLGLNTNATVGPPKDSLDVESNRPPPPEFSNTFFSLEDSVRLVTEVKPFEDQLNWKLIVEFGSQEEKITMDWKDENDSNPFTNLQGYNAVFLVDQNMLVDMKSPTVTSHLFEVNEPNEKREIFILFRRDTYTRPVANPDTQAVLKGASTTVDVLAGDSDDDGDELFIEKIPEDQQPQKGSAVIETINGKQQITYTPNEGAIGEDTFGYTISDGFTTSTATITVLLSDIVFIRTVDPFILAGESFPVSVEIRYTSQVDTQRVTLMETLPEFDDEFAVYAIPSGTGPDGLAINGSIVPESPVVLDGNTVTFTWNSSTNTSLPPGSFTFQYMLIGSADDRDPKSISGAVSHESGMIGIDLKSSFLPVNNMNHTADINKNFVLELSELQRVIALFRAGEYLCDSSQPDGYGIGAGDRTCTPHSSDLDDNFSIDLGGLQRLIVLFRPGEYHPDNSTLDGFSPGPLF